MKAKLKIGVASVVVAAATAVGVGVAAQADASGWKARATLRVADGTEIGQVTVTASGEGTTLKVAIQDNGIGITPEELGKLGTPYFRSDNEIVLAFNEAIREFVRALPERR